jgi:hypothetical protein
MRLKRGSATYERGVVAVLLLEALRYLQLQLHHLLAKRHEICLQRRTCLLADAPKRRQLSRRLRLHRAACWLRCIARVPACRKWPAIKSGSASRHSL